jgi:protocatechuate 3,4-dioxygenase beta subunit
MAVDRILRGAFVLLLTSLIASIPLFAQKITGDISGTVTDPSGAAVPNAIVNAVNLGTNEKAAATTNEAGFYRMVNLSPGQYRVSVNASGFKSMERQATSPSRHYGIELPLVGTGETVAKSRALPLIETTEDRLSTLFDDNLLPSCPTRRRLNNL